MSEPARQAAPIRLRVRVLPGGRRSEVVDLLGDSWKLRVRAPPERGKANSEVIELLARTLGLPRGALRIVAGHTAVDKVVTVDLLTRDEVERHLAAGARGSAS